MHISHAQLSLHWACQFCLCSQTGALELKMETMTIERSANIVVKVLWLAAYDACTHFSDSRTRFQMMRTLSACRPGSALPIVSKIALSLDIRHRKAKPRLLISAKSVLRVIHSFMIATNPNLRQHNIQVEVSRSAA